ncbi:MAG: CopG family ribbon-helix-helix protein [Candidatus Thorarchaeota archaeon]
MQIVAVSMTDQSFEELEKLRIVGGYSNRSEAVRHAIQLLMAEHRKLDAAEGNITAVLTVLYPAGERGTHSREIHHEFGHLLSSMMHAHSIDGSCVDVMVVRGDADQVRFLLKRLRSETRATRISVELLGGA